MFSINNHSHRRQNILTGEWVLVSPHRSKRPWQGQEEKIRNEQIAAYDPNCYLCPGNTRANGAKNPEYADVYSFQNDFAALQFDVPFEVINDDFLKLESERGICKVICFSPRHDLTVPEMKNKEIEKVVKLWIDECKELGSIEFINNIQIFENKGSVMGCSNPHPHGQIWAQQSIPMESVKKGERQLEYYNKTKRTLLGDYLLREIGEKERILYRNESFTVLVPFWATWPYETMIVPHRPMRGVTELTDEESVDFADAYKWITVRYDNIFEVSFPYSAGIHQAPFDGRYYPEWHWHMVFYPPLLRSALVRKFMVGYEMLANPQRDITPEQSADIIRRCSDLHYKAKNQ